MFLLFIKLFKSIKSFPLTSVRGPTISNGETESLGLGEGGGGGCNITRSVTSQEGSLLPANIDEVIFGKEISKCQMFFKNTQTFRVYDPSSE